jgi:S1-C subfamily serine protease
MAHAKKTLYEILGVPADAGPEDIVHAHDRRVYEQRRAENPDPNAQVLLQQAFEVLSNPKRRAAYDASLVTAAERTAAAQQVTDLEIEPEADSERARKMRLLGMVGGMALIFAVLFFVFRPRPVPSPPLPAPVAEAPKPAPPRLRTGPEILADASTSSGQVMSYSMSGAATPLGMASEIEAGQMVTTCHAIPAGGKLVVKIGKEIHAADLAITDEQLDLCRLSIPGLTTPPLKLAAEDAKAGDKVYVVGMNAKGELAATEGKVTQLRTSPQGPVLEVSVPIAPTGSGGGVFNEQGQLVGIATTPHTYGAGLNIALPVSWIASMRSRAAAPK